MNQIIVTLKIQGIHSQDICLFYLNPHDEGKTLEEEEAVMEVWWFMENLEQLEPLTFQLFAFSHHFYYHLLICKYSRVIFLKISHPMIGMLGI